MRTHNALGAALPGTRCAVLLLPPRAALTGQRQKLPFCSSLVLPRKKCWLQLMAKEQPAIACNEIAPIVDIVHGDHCSPLTARWSDVSWLPQRSED